MNKLDKEQREAVRELIFQRTSLERVGNLCQTDGKGNTIVCGDIIKKYIEAIEEKLGLNDE